eukprot:310093-Amphidinium_carterae.1
MAPALSHAALAMDYNHHSVIAVSAIHTMVNTIFMQLSAMKIHLHQPNVRNQKPAVTFIIHVLLFTWFHNIRIERMFNAIRHPLHCISQCRS